jgi:DNA-binding PadR family transcriptional regulator
VAGRRGVDNPLALAVLSWLTRGPMHPYELGRLLREADTGRSIKLNHGSLYMVFGQLAKAGLIEALPADRQGQRPERTPYALTAAGRAEMHTWLRRLIAEPDHEYPQFVAALSLVAALPPHEVVELLGERLERIRLVRAGITDLIRTALAAGSHPLFLVEEEYRLALLDAETDFVERFVARITDPDDGWGPAWARVLADPARGGPPTAGPSDGADAMAGSDGGVGAGSDGGVGAGADERRARGA